MIRALILLTLLATASACASRPAPEPPPTPTSMKEAASAQEQPGGAEATTIGDVVVTPLHHGSLTLTWEGRVIQVDPVTRALEAATGGQPGSVPKADLILVTHIHGDHLDPEAIALLRKEGAPVITPASVAEKAGDALKAPTVIENGASIQVLDGTVEVEAFPMYNLVRKRDNGDFYHPKGRGNGYIVRVGGQAIYISGDTECTPEMKALTDIDAAFVCMNLPYTMTVPEAAECVRSFKPKVLYPYHHRDQDPTQLKALLADVPETELRILDWYPEAK